MPITTPSSGAQRLPSIRRSSWQIAGIKHQLLEVWAVDDIVISRIEVTYTRKDGSTLTVPAVTIWRVRDRQIDDYRIYIDVAPLFAH
jgi:ketosteroid isomerase-like protein